MSLKSFHIFFILTAIVLSFGFSWWCFSPDASGSPGNALMGVVSLLIGAALVVYGNWFCRKMLKATGVS